MSLPATKNISGVMSSVRMVSWMLLESMSPRMPASVMTLEKREVSELASASLRVSTSLEKRLIISPWVWVS